MVFKAKTLDLTEDIDTTFPYTLPSSPESTICPPLGHSCMRPVAARVATGVSELFTATRPAPGNKKKEEKKKSRELRCITPADIDLKLPDLKQLRSFTYRELEIATDGFDKKNVLGEGGFGPVYRGHLPSGYPVAVKRFKHDSRQGVAQFRAEVQAGKMAMHRNVLTLFGFCELTEPRELLLVYPFMENESLAYHLSRRPVSQPSMDWETRKRIALGVARGLSYLHDCCFLRIIHRDIKPSNILLDENLEPRIADFGLARFMGHKVQEVHIDGVVAHSRMVDRSAEHLDDDSEHSTDRVCGTYGYIAPEYAMRGRYSQKTDVFAYGIVLLELISGCNFVKLQSLANRERIAEPSDWVKRLVDAGNLERVIDKSMGGIYSKTEVERLIKLSLICTQFHSPAKRPNMSEVVGMLEGSNGSLDKRWGKFQQNRVEVMAVRPTFNQEICSSCCTGFAYSDSHIDAEELSGPR